MLWLLLLLLLFVLWLLWLPTAVINTRDMCASPPPAAAAAASHHHCALFQMIRYLMRWVMVTWSDGIKENNDHLVALRKKENEQHGIVLRNVLLQVQTMMKREQVKDSNNDRNGAHQEDREKEQQRLRLREASKTKSLLLSGTFHKHERNLGTRFGLTHCFFSFSLCLLPLTCCVSFLAFAAFLSPQSNTCSKKCWRCNLTSARCRDE